jgi:SPP1 family predicted phage head-tail adaptor
MKLPKQPWGTRYQGSTDYNTQITFIQPNNGNGADGAPLPATTVATTWANVAQWRGKQEDKTQTLQAVSSYKMIIRYPQTWSIDSGMNIFVREQQHNIESYSDPDGNQNELHIWTWVGDDTVNA